MVVVVGLGVFAVFAKEWTVFLKEEASSLVVAGFKPEDQVNYLQLLPSIIRSYNFSKVCVCA